MPASKELDKGTICVATVEGDIHDIGKNIVKMLLDNYGYTVIDLGRDVKPQAVLDAVREHGIKLVGLSALMTTTVPNMAKTIDLLHREAPGTLVMVGGAVLTPNMQSRSAPISMPKTPRSPHASPQKSSVNAIQLGRLRVFRIVFRVLPSRARFFPTNTQVHVGDLGLLLDKTRNEYEKPQHLCRINAAIDLSGQKRGRPVLRPRPR